MSTAFKYMSQFNFLPRQETLKRVQELMKQNPKEETGGFVLVTPKKDILIPSINTAIDKKIAFKLSESARLTLQRKLSMYPQGTVTFYHSHVEGISTFSRADLRNIQNYEAQGCFFCWYLYHVGRDVEEWYIPNKYLAQTVA